MKSTLSIKVTEKEKLRLFRVAKERNLKPSDLLRAALNLIIGEDATKKKQSCFDVCADLIPTEESKLPADLSTGKEPMRSFGR
jgi:hypothetical protein